MGRVRLDDSRPKSKKQKAKEDILSLLTASPGLSQSEFVTRITTAGRNTIITALSELEIEKSIISRQAGLRNEKFYSLPV